MKAPGVRQLRVEKKKRVLIDNRKR